MPRNCNDCGDDVFVTADGIALERCKSCLQARVFEDIDEPATV